MEDEKGGQPVTASEVWAMAIVVVVISWVIVIFILVAFWDQICAKIVLDAIKYGIEQLPPPK